VKNIMPGIVFGKNFLRKKLFITFLCISFMIFKTTFLYAQDSINAQQEPPIEAEVGLFIMNLSDVTVTTSTFNVIFWAWTYDKTGKYLPIHGLSVTNAKKFESRFPGKGIMKQNDVWSNAKYFATIHE